MVVVMASIAAACSSAGTRRLTARDDRLGAGPRSIVQLGDSIASGEGTLYGYTYDSTKKEWTGGDVNAPWPPPYPDCHVSDDAYGKVVARAFSSDFHQYACTGASFASGIVAPEVVSGKTRRPAEFGDWSTKQNLNADYDAAKPDLVLVTLGADDVVFSDIVEDCIKNGYKHYWAPRLYPLECVDDNPGPTVKKDYFDFKPTLKKNYSTLGAWIQDRAKANNVPIPKIVFTTYANPLPKKGADCDDINYLYGDQVDYLTSLLQDMNGIIKSTIKDLNKRYPGAAVADIEKAYQAEDIDHRWCTNDPWAYGLSIYKVSEPSSFYSLAPFHPTPAGQRAIADAVIPTVANLFRTAYPVDTTSTTTPAPPGG